MKTFKKTGDQGETSLLHGVRVPKDDPRCEAFGTLDEASSALGLARHWARPRTGEAILSIQQDLLALGGEIALPRQAPRPSQGPAVTLAMVDRLQRLIEELEGETEMPRHFVLPGGTPAAGFLDLARTLVRRAERRAVSLRRAGGLDNPAVLSYLNRLADLLYTMARYEEQR